MGQSTGPALSGLPSPIKPSRQTNSWSIGCDIAFRQKGGSPPAGSELKTRTGRPAGKYPPVARARTTTPPGGPVTGPERAVRLNRDASTLRPRKQLSPVLERAELHLVNDRPCSSRRANGQLVLRASRELNAVSILAAP